MRAAEIAGPELAVEEFDGKLNAEFDGVHERRGVVQQDVVERRQHRRYAVDAMAEVLVLNGTLLFRGRVLDISLAGCYIETQARLRLEPGTLVEMIFRVKDVAFRLVATSRMVRPGRGAGFLFSNLNARTLAGLEGLIAELSLPADG